MAFWSFLTFHLALVTAAAAQSSSSSSSSPSSSATPTNHIITVGGNTTSNATLVFQPSLLYANINDTVTFNFTQGNHSATESTFGEPCVYASDSNSTINGFDSGPRNTDNGTVFTQLTITITGTQPIWYFDVNLCSTGGVGAINPNESSTLTLEGFIRNAERLNGTMTSSIPSATYTNLPPNPSSGSGGSSGGSSSSGGVAERTAFLGAAIAVPLIMLGAAML